MSVEIITAPRTFADFEAIHTLLRNAFADMAGRIDPPSSLNTMMPDDLRQKATSETLILAQSDTRIVGCLFCKPMGDSLYLGKLAVAGDCRGRGIARSLMDHAADLARQYNLPALTLQTRVELLENHATFQALGFHISGQTRHPGYDRTTSLMFRRLL